MAYQAKRKQRYTETFELTEEDGTVVHTLQVALDADSVVKQLAEKHLALLHAYEAVQKLDSKDEEAATQGLEVLGNAVVDLIQAVFGEENAKVIVEFYQNRPIEMCREVTPFITNVVIPQIRKIAQENKRQALAAYNRKTKRTLFQRK